MHGYCESFYVPNIIAQSAGSMRCYFYFEGVTIIQTKGEHTE